MPYVFLNPDGTQDYGVIVIVEHATGVTYAQQCGGLATELRTLEGFVIPVAGPDMAQQLYQWFWSQFRGNCHSSAGKWTEDVVAQLRHLVAAIPCWLTAPDGQDEQRFLELDETRLHECIEAWIPVLTPYGRGILTLKNSD